MRRVLFILAAFTLVAMSGHSAHAVEFGTRTKYQRLADLTAKGPKGEALALGYETVTHSFLLPYKMTGDYVLVVKGGAKGIDGRPLNVYDRLPHEKIAQMQRAGALPNPLPVVRHTMFEYLFAYILWWCIPVTLAFIMLFSKLGIGSDARSETRSA